MRQQDKRKIFEVFQETSDLLTEQRNPRSTNIDSMSVEDILRLINDEDLNAVKAVRSVIPDIAKAVEVYVETFKSGHRVFYIGAGTSGRLGILDAAELPPTFGTRPWQVQGLIAGGYGALIRAIEGAEDHEEYGIEDLKERGVTKHDFVIGLAASKRTPYVVGALKYAKRIGCKTALITAIPKEKVDLDVDILICPIVGPEVVTGSTRMKAGTAQKLILNMISTSAMILLGKVYENLMVDLWATSYKLLARSVRVVMTITGLGYKEAEELLDRAGGSVKKAIVMHIANCSSDVAEDALQRANGFVKKAIELIKNPY